MEERMWSRLPDTALIEIYMYLSDRWKINMAMSCRNWYRVFLSPCLWRSRFIELGGYRAKSAGQRACKFADQHGAQLRHLFLTCSHPSSETCKTMTLTVESFFQKIHQSRLVHFQLERLNLDRFWKYETLKARVIHSFCRFFREQRHLRNFDMGDAHFSLNNGCRILEAVGSGSGATIEILGLIDFFKARLTMYLVKRYREALSKFTNLSHVALKYSCLSDSILTAMSYSLGGKLRIINIMVSKNDPHFHRITSNAWKNLKLACPDLSINVWFETIGMSSEIIRVLAPEAPFRDIRLWTGYDDNADWQLCDSIKHIADHQKQIVVLSLELDNIHEFIGNSLVNLVSNCKALKELYINAVLTVGTIDTVCTLLTERKIDIQTLHITTCGLSEVECVELMNITEKHLPVMLERGLNFRIVSDYYADAIL